MSQLGCCLDIACRQRDSQALLLNAGSPVVVSDTGPGHVPAAFMLVAFCKRRQLCTA